MNTKMATLVKQKTSRHAEKKTKLKTANFQTLVAYNWWFFIAKNGMHSVLTGSK